MTKELIYIRDKEGYVKGITLDEMKPEYTQITREEWEEESGEKYYKVTYGRGGARKGAGRKPKTGVVLKFQIRVSEKEKEFLNYARAHNLDYDSLMQG
ncbi:TPA: hypothetical protein CPT80_03700 [Candidatus Gastranaerophilales bacterium HUM_9]|nr:MAG TPA: hypothetical protein CPT80_03700 [Candidatus Gastranaerophilales bacterium HUM_9]HBX35374.1 hypothetical protein [Cyanobacteria bacterium UBA11440]